MPSAQDSSAYEDEPNSPQVRRSPTPSEDDRAERRKSPSDSSSFDSSSSDDDAEDDEPEFRPSKSTIRHENESPYDSFEEVDGSDNSQPSKAPRTSRTEFRNVDAELYDLRRSGRARRTPKILDDDEDESEVEEVRSLGYVNVHYSFMSLTSLGFENITRATSRTTMTTLRILDQITRMTTVAATLDTEARKSLHGAPKSRLDHQVEKVRMNQPFVIPHDPREFCMEKVSNCCPFDVRQAAKGEDNPEDYTPTYTIL